MKKLFFALAALVLTIPAMGQQWQPWAMKPDTADAIQYVASTCGNVTGSPNAAEGNLPCSDSNDGKSWGTAKLTLSGLTGACPTTGSCVGNAANGVFSATSASSPHRFFELRCPSVFHGDQSGASLGASFQGTTGPLFTIGHPQQTLNGCGWISTDSANPVLKIVTTSATNGDLIPEIVELRNTFVSGGSSSVLITDTTASFFPDDSRFSSDYFFKPTTHGLFFNPATFNAGINNIRIRDSWLHGNGTATGLPIYFDNRDGSAAFGPNAFDILDNEISNWPMTNFTTGNNWGAVHLGGCGAGFIAANDFESIGPTTAVVQNPSAISANGCTGVLIGPNNFLNTYLPIDASSSTGVFITPQHYPSIPVSGFYIEGGGALDLFAFGVPASGVKDTPTRASVWFQNGFVENYGYNLFDLNGNSTAVWPRFRLTENGTANWEVGYNATGATADFAIRDMASGVNRLVIPTGGTGTVTVPAATGTIGLTLSGSVAGSVTALVANSCGDAVTATITGATTAMVATASPQAAISAGLTLSTPFVSAANTVTVGYCNVTTAAITPAAATFNIRVIQ